MLPTYAQVCSTTVLDQTPLIERVPFMQEIKNRAATQRHTRNCKETSTMNKLIGLQFQTKTISVTFVISCVFCVLYHKSSIKW